MNLSTHRLKPTDTRTDFRPLNVCRACNQVTPQCMCEPSRDCPRCQGRGFNCIDDICHGRGRCMHGNTCTHCDGRGAVRPERVLVAPDPDAAAIRDFLAAHPELVDGEYADREADSPLSLLCYPAAEAYYHLTDCNPEVYCLSWSDVDGDLSGTHWYLRESAGDRRWIDLSLPLMPPVDLPPFAEGTHRGFITGDGPSERAGEVLREADVRWNGVVA